MKVSTKIARRSLLLLAFQLAIVSSIAAKYLYERQHCPRVWTRAVAYDPELVLRGRYLNMQLHIDACGVTLPPRSRAKTLNNSETGFFDENGVMTPNIEAQIGTSSGKLVVTALDRDQRHYKSSYHWISLRKEAGCRDAILNEPVDFYIPEHAQSPFPLNRGSYLWVEVTIPPKGPPRPIQLALNQNGQWKLLPF